MKVDHSVKKFGDLPGAEVKSRSRNGGEKIRTVGVACDSVHLSSDLMQLQAPAAEKSGGSVFDSKRVEEIKVAIAEGRFEVNPQKIADGLIATVKDLLGARKI
jgi:negative regulator of flagellin synthesis FlgM